jgi:tripartite-type tricarboxylate transporter receptor subunit TctC
MHHGNLSRRRLLTQAGTAGLALGLGPMAFAQADYPNQPIHFIVPFAAGGVTDLTMRTVSKYVSDHMGHPIIIDNRAGAGGTVGMVGVARANPNGYTIGATASSSLIATPLLNNDVPFDPSNDFAFICLLATVPMVLTVPASVPATNAAEFLKYVAANRGKLNYGSTAVGHYGHVAMMEVSDSLKAGMVHSPYKGEAPLMQDLLGGTLQAAFFAPSTAKPMADAGKLRMLGISGAQRLKTLPNLPTLAEQGWSAPIFKMNPGWVVVIAPAKTPAPIVARLTDEYVGAIRNPGVAEQISEYGMDPVGANGEQFAATYRAEKPIWRALLAKAGLEIKGQ